MIRDCVNTISHHKNKRCRLHCHKETNTNRIEVICISGKAQAGKDTVACMLKEYLESKKQKRVLVVHYADLLKFICQKYFGWDGVKDEKGRTLLQHVGTEQVRAKRPDFWVDFVVDLIGLFRDEWDYVIIPDTRFPNEILKIESSGYNVVRIDVVRPDFDNQLTAEQQTHISETALENFKPDITITNNGNLDELEQTVETVWWMLTCTHCGAVPF